MTVTIAGVIEQNLVGIVLAAVGLAAAYFFYRRSVVRARLGWVAQSVRVTGRDSTFTPDLKIFYKDREVERVTKSSLILWNFGNATIDGDRLVDTDRLRVLLSKGAEILDFSVTNSSRPVIGFALTREPNSDILECRFDYLDPNDGVWIEVLHTGTKLSVGGSVRGIPDGVRFLGPIPDAFFSGPDNITLLLSSLFGAGLAGGSIWLSSGSWADTWGKLMLFALLALLGALILCGSLIGILVNLGRWAISKPRPPLTLLLNVTGEQGKTLFHNPDGNWT